MPLSDCDPITTLELVDPTLTMAGVTLTGSSLTSGNLVLPALKATWTASTNPAVLGIQFEYVPTDASSGPVRTAAQGNSLVAWTATDGIIAGKIYGTRWRAVGQNAVGNWSSVSNLTPSSTLVASSVDGQAAAATDTTIVPGATQNKYFNQGTDPALTQTIIEFAQWFDSAHGLLYSRIGGSWILVGNLTVSLTDGTVIFDSSTAGSFSCPIPSNALTHADIYVFAGGGGGGVTHGGGGSGYAKYSLLAVTPGTTVIVGTIGGGGRGADPSVPLTATAGIASTITSPAITVNGGGSGQTSAGAGGGASGGTTNTTGEPGDTGATGNGGANLGTGTYNGGARQTTSGANGNPPGGGGAANATTGGHGASGRVVIVTRT